MALYRRPDSKFWWIWLDGSHGTRINTKIPIGTTPKSQQKNRRAAEDIYHDLMADRARQRFGLPITRKPRTFVDHRAWYAEHVSPQKRGTTREVSMLKQLGAFFDDYLLSEIDPILAREWRTTRLKTVSASTVSREEALLKHLLTTAVPTYLEQNPLRGLSRLRVAGTDTRVLTHDEERRLLEHLKTPEDRALILGALDTLLRLSNIARVAWQQDHGTYLFTDTKAGTVKVPISTRFRQALDALPQSSPWCFPTYARLASNNEVIRMFTEACARAQIPMGRKAGGVSFHCLRHTGATRMLEAGVDVKTVMRIGGWKNLKVLERYLHPSDDAARTAVESIGIGTLPHHSQSR